MWVMENRRNFVCYLCLPLKHFFVIKLNQHIYISWIWGLMLLFYLYVCSVICVCLRIVLSSTYCVVFLFGFLRLVYPLLPVSLDCPFFIAPSVFSNVYFILTSYKSLYYRKSLLIKEFCFCHLPKMYNISIFTIQNKNKALKTLLCFNPINN